MNSTHRLHSDVLVLGGGAAGLFCAITAGQRGQSVTVLEHNARIGNKILISGGGRCNFTNLGATAANFVTSGSTNFVKSALARYTPREFLELVERHGILWHEKKLGQLFCDESSRLIVDLLEKECADANVSIQKACLISGVERQKDPNNPGRTQGWIVRTKLGDYSSKSLVIATGGLSFPKLGATPFGYSIARQFGIALVPTRPGLVPLTFETKDLGTLAELSGVSVDVEVSIDEEKPKFRENLLFTHRGLSGPAILQISSYLDSKQRVCINLLPSICAAEYFSKSRVGGRELKTVLRELLPERLVQAWASGVPFKAQIAQMPQRDLDTVLGSLQNWQFLPAGDEGYPKAEVTVGGVSTDELSSKTMESRKIPGLYLVGEVVDVTGWLGGYNFQWAWSSGFAAGQAVG